MTSYKHAGPDNFDILRKIGKNSKNSKFAIKVLNIRISPGFLIIQKDKRKMVIPTCSVSFSIIVCRYFSKWRIIFFLKTEKVATTPVTLWLWRLTLPPGKVVPPIFLHEYEKKKEITYMPLVNFFSVLERPGKNRKGGCNNPHPLG